MNKPKISIIVPVYKVEQHLSLCIDSVLVQTFKDFELLLIDDGSPDKSGEICDKYALKDNRIRVFHKINGGVSSARNVGLENARGEWIYFVDSDDQLKKDGLQILFDGTKNGAKLVNAGYEIYNESSALIYVSKIPHEKIFTNDETVLIMFKPIGNDYYGYLWCKLFNSKLIKDSALRFNENISFNEDRLFIVQYLCKNKINCFYTNQIVYNYYIRQNSAMASLKQKFNYKFVTDLEAFVLMLNEVKTIGNKKCIYWNKRGLYDSHLAISKMMKNNGIKDNILKNKIDLILKDNVSLYLRLFFFNQRIIAYLKRIIKNIIK